MRVLDTGWMLEATRALVIFLGMDSVIDKKLDFIVALAAVFDTGSCDNWDEVICNGCCNCSFKGIGCWNL